MTPFLDRDNGFLDRLEITLIPFSRFTKSFALNS